MCCYLPLSTPVSVSFGDIPPSVVMGDALYMFLRNEETKPVTCLPDICGQEVAVVLWYENNCATLKRGEPVGVRNLSKNKGVEGFAANLPEGVDAIDLLQHDTLD